jgi:outer membrane biosynthesis protein TonB
LPRPVISRLTANSKHFALAVLALAVFVAGAAPAPAQKTSKSERRVLVSVKPVYSDFLRRSQIGGLVRLKATVSPEGKVTNVDIIGGNPILAESGSAAVMQWKFAPAAAQSIEEISLSFNPH